MKNIKELLITAVLILFGLFLVFGMGIPNMDYDNAPYKSTVEATAVRVDSYRETDEDENKYYSYRIVWELELNGEITQITGTEESVNENRWSVGDKKEIEVYSKDGKKYKPAMDIENKKTYISEIIGGSVLTILGVLYLAVTLKKAINDKNKSKHTKQKKI